MDVGRSLRLIVKMFPDTNPEIPFVNERFHANWHPDHKWGWQENRAIVGHNLKIAWNLTRVANYHLGEVQKAKAAEKNGHAKKVAKHQSKADSLLKLAEKLGLAMAKVGIDQVRGGCFDAVEREPQNGMPVNFTWGNTKDFWQQEQGILAYLILHTATQNEDFLNLAREMTAFWNLFFLDHDHRGIFFRVTDNGNPYIQGNYGNKGGHSVSGYHAFELNYLAHIYIRTYMLQGCGCEDNFCLYFKPDRKRSAFTQRPARLLPARRPGIGLGHSQWRPAHQRGLRQLPNPTERVGARL